jgi:hypothetical protein
MNALPSQKQYSTIFHWIQFFLAIIPILSFLLQQTHLGVATSISFVLLVLKVLSEHAKPQKQQCMACRKLANVQNFTISNKRVALCARCYVHSPAYKSQKGKGRYDH